MQPGTIETYPNAYHVLIHDADYIISLAEKAETGEFKDEHAKTRFSRNAILLLILSTEALANRIVNLFARGDVREIITRNEKSLSFLDKLILTMSSNDVERAEELHPDLEPWLYLKTLKNIRNQLVHPNENFPVYYTMQSDKSLHFSIPENEMKRLKIKNSDRFYKGLDIPKDPYGLLPIHAKRIRKVVQDIEVQVREIFQHVAADPTWPTHDIFRNC